MLMHIRKLGNQTYYTLHSVYARNITGDEHGEFSRSDIYAVCMYIYVCDGVSVREVDEYARVSPR